MSAVGLDAVVTTKSFQRMSAREGVPSCVRGFCQNSCVPGNGPGTSGIGELVIQRAFVSFDCEQDARMKDPLVEQAKRLDSPFEVFDWSIKRPWAAWQNEARPRIVACDLVIVLCGMATHYASGVTIELPIAQEENIPYFLLSGFADGAVKPQHTRPEDKLYSWTWGGIKALTNGTR